MSRRIMGCVNNIQCVDHINHDTFNNQRSNLRIASKSQNAANSFARGGTSKYKGVSLHKPTGKWRARIKRGKEIHLGVFSSEEEAAVAYDKKAIELYKDFAFTNYSYGTS